MNLQLKAKKSIDNNINKNRIKNLIIEMKLIK